MCPNAGDKGRLALVAGIVAAGARLMPERVRAGASAGSFTEGAFGGTFASRRLAVVPDSDSMLTAGAVPAWSP